MSELWPEGQSEGYEAHDGVLEPERIPFYKPDIYPVLLQKNVSVFGRFLGDSDVDKIADQQNTTNRIEAKIIDKLVKSGSYMSLPDDASIKADAEDMKIIRPGNPAAAQLINVYDMEGRVQQDMAYLEQVYQEARQVIGITDSFQGRHDATATSGKAKEFAAAEKAGLGKILADRKAAAKGAAAEDEDVKAPPAEPCTASIPGIEVMDLEDAAKALWKAGIYAETGMGCTGPLVMMSEANLAKSQEILKAAGYIG